MARESFFALDLACSLLPAPDNGSQTQGRKGSHKNRRNAGATGLSKLISDTSQVSLLQVYFSSSAFSQKVSRKQLRGSFINVSCLRAQHRRFAPSVPLGAEVVKGGSGAACFQGPAEMRKGSQRGPRIPGEG